MIGIKELRSMIEKKKGKRDQIQKSIEDSENRLADLKKDIKYVEQAQHIIQLVATQTQMELEYHISDIVSFALESVLENPYKFKVKFVPRRGKTEAELLFVTKDGNEITDPLDESGFGAIDVASTALRFSLWSMRNPRTRPVFILDEPEMHLKGREMPKKYGEMLRTVSTKLGIQIIIISHTNDIIEVANRVFNVEKKGNISKVTQL